MDPITVGLIVAGISTLVGGAVGWKNAKSQQQINQDNIDAQKAAAEQEQKYNLENWNRENAYNHPEQQMARLRQAGLNPNLVYGRGADATAGSINKTSVNAPNLQAPMYDVSPLQGAINSGLQAYNQTRATTASVDQTNSTIALQAKEANLKQAELTKKAAETANLQQDYATKLKLQDYLVKKAELENVNLDAFTKIGIQRNEREQLMNASDLKLKAQDLLNKKTEWLLNHQKYATTQYEQQKLQAEIDNLKVMNGNLRSEGVVKQFEADMAKKGISKNSPWWWQNLNSVLSGPSMDLTPQQTQMYIDKAKYTPSTTKNYNDGWNWNNKR